MTKLKWKYFLIIPIAAIVLSIWGLFTDRMLFNKEVLSYIVIGLINTATIWLGCMAIVNFLWKKFPWEQKPKIHLFLEVLSIIVYAVIIEDLLHRFQIKMGLIENDVSNNRANASFTILITLLITSIHEAYFFYKQWKLNFSKSVKLEKDNINAKYEALKAQINPHFLFNSLNSLVTLVEDNNVATDYIMDLSDFLRYMLKSREREVVLVREEIEILNKYINLQKTRFGENLHVDMKVSEKVYHYAVPPLVLQMLLENCIKHNIISKSKPLLIKIYAKEDYIYVENNLQKKDGVSSTGNGIKNISQRYTFLTTQKIDIKQTNSKFTVGVPIVMVDL